MDSPPQPAPYRDTGETARDFVRLLTSLPPCATIRLEIGGEVGRQMVHVPTLVEERKLGKLGYRLVAGIDEVGRGPLAGPVVAGAVVLRPGARYSWLRQVRDSKELTAKARQQLFDHIRSDAVSWGVGSIPSEVIDDQGIARATHLAMHRAVSLLTPVPDFLLIDAVRLLEVNIPQRSIIKGDQLCASIAAASIMAKVSRDRMMCDLDGEHPGYGFARHKGYGTAEHLDCLRRLGPCPIHRRSFSPVKEVLGGLFRPDAPGFSLGYGFSSGSDVAAT